jgi:uncharacterized membrane protein YccC
VFDVDRRRARDLTRVGLQTAAAVTLVYVVMRWYSIDHLSWAIISALFTIQLSSDSTVSVALYRVVAALVGTALGLAAVLLFQWMPGSWPVLAALLTACVIANLMSSTWPSLNYIAVAAAIVALDADAEVLTALERALAILIGSVGAAAASFLVWPETARARALRNIAYALDDCRRLVEASLGGFNGEEAENTRRVDLDFARHIETARQIVGDARFRRKLTKRHSLSDGLVAIERLWHGAVGLDRAAEERSAALTDADLATMKPLLDGVRRRTADYLGGLVRYLEGRDRAPPAIGAVEACLREVEETLRRAEPETHLTEEPERERAVAALRFGIDEFRKNLREIDEVIGPGRRELERRMDEGMAQDGDSTPPEAERETAR